MPVIKIILLGDTSVGKTSFVSKYLKHDIPVTHKSTIGAAMNSKKIDLYNTSVDLHIWDTAGQERYSSLTSLYYRSSNIAIIMYDITNPDSFIKAQDYYYDLISKGPENIVIGLVGNKSDIAIQDPLRRTIPFSVGKDWADTHNILFAETNVFNDNDAKCVFGTLIEQLPNDVIFSIKDEDDSLLDNFMENAERYNLYTYKSNKFNDCCIIS
jgi:Ras-related protein Rab-5C